MNMKVKHRKISIKLIMILLGGFTLLVNYLFSFNPYITEAAYSRGLFQLIRFSIDYTVGLLPIPVLDVMLVMFLVLDAILIIRYFKTKKRSQEEKKPLKIRIFKGIFSFSAFIGSLIFLFYFLWGFNYDRLPIEDHLHIHPLPLSPDEVRLEAKRAFDMVIESRQALPGIKLGGRDALDEKQLPENWEEDIRQNMKRVLKLLGYPAPGRVRVKKLWTAGILMSMGTSGFYFPLTGEAYIPENLTPVEIPFIAAHEMAHGYGFSQEGTANFLAYLVCLSSQDPFVLYSGNLAYFSHISRELRRISKEEFSSLYKLLPPGVIADLVKKNKNWEKYRGWLMDWSAKAYDGYLKAQGVSDGIKSYNRLVVLATAWRKASKK